MPIFEYKCKKCKKISEVLVRNINNKVKCKFCGSAKLEKIFSAFATNARKSSAKSAGSRGKGCSCGGSCKTKRCGTCSH